MLGFLLRRDGDVRRSDIRRQTLAVALRAIFYKNKCGRRPPQISPLQEEGGANAPGDGQRMLEKSLVAEFFVAKKRWMMLIIIQRFALSFFVT